MNFPTVSILGLGYIGLPTAILLAAKGVKVHGIDVQQCVVDSINAGQVHIVEAGLENHLKNVINNGHLRANTQVRAADVFVITVPTPIDSEHRPDLSYIKAATEAIAKVLTKGNLIILESTSPVGTTEQVQEWLINLRADLTFPKNGQNGGEDADIQLAYCPERVLPGNILHELVHNDRIIGGLTINASQKAKNLYEIFVQGALHTSDARTAELTKLSENSFRDVNIAFANELDLICHKLGLQSSQVIELANKHPRVSILQAGCGVGGHCIPVDPWFIVNNAPDEAQLIHCARKVNDNRPKWIVEQIKAKIWQVLIANPQKSMGKIIVSCLGLSYKADTDDLRNSPALEIVQSLAELGGEVQVVSPHVHTLPLNSQNVRLCDLDTALTTADVICILVKDKEFLEKRLHIAKHKNVLDFAGFM